MSDDIEPGNGGFAHLIIQGPAAQAMSDPKPVTAICGLRFITQAFPGDFPLCPICEQIKEDLDTGILEHASLWERPRRTIAGRDELLSEIVRLNALVPNLVQNSDQLARNYWSLPRVQPLIKTTAEDLKETLDACLALTVDPETRPSLSREFITSLKRSRIIAYILRSSIDNIMAAFTGTGMSVSRDGRFNESRKLRLAIIRNQVTAISQASQFDRPASPDLAEALEEASEAARGVSSDLALNFDYGVESGTLTRAAIFTHALARALKMALSELGIEAAKTA